MVNMPSINKSYIGFNLDVELVALAKREAKNRKMTLTDFVQYIIQKELDKSGTELTNEDTEWIIEQIRKNKEKRNNG